MTRQERYQLIKDFVTRFILEKIEPQGFTYHNLKHTLSVAERAEYLAKKEGLDEDTVEKIKVAAFFHDLGLVNGQYQDHEARSADIFRQFNQQYKLYSPEDEEQIVDIILATKVSYTNPIKIEHKIIKDADLDNLGTDEFFDNSKFLYEELNNLLGDKLPNFEDFLANTYNLFKDFEFFTETQKKERLAKWKENLNILKCMAKKGKVCPYFDKYFTF